MIRYRKATKQDLRIIAKMVAEAFADYPLYRIICNSFNDRKKYMKFMEDMNYVFLRSSMKSNPCLICIVDGKIASTALLERPGNARLDIIDYIFSGGIRLFKEINIFRMLSFLKVVEDSRKAYDTIREPFWVLEILVVDKDSQGKQLGSKMLHECIIPYIKRRHGKKILLTTNTEINYKFYNKNGFNDFDHKVIGKKDCSMTNWTFQMDLTDS